MSTIRYNNGETRDTVTMCNHCKGNCACPGRRFAAYGRPGCAAGTCACPSPVVLKTHATNCASIKFDGEACDCGVGPQRAPAVTYSALDVIFVKIRSTGSRGLRLADDGGIGTRFLEWTIKERIYSIGGGSYSGPDGIQGVYDAECAEKIRAWLKECGAVEDDEKTWERRS